MRIFGRVVIFLVFIGETETILPLSTVIEYSFPSLSLTISLLSYPSPGFKI